MVKVGLAAGIINIDELRVSLDSLMVFRKSFRGSEDEDKVNELLSSALDSGIFSEDAIAEALRTYSQGEVVEFPWEVDVEADIKQQISDLIVDQVIDVKFSPQIIAQALMDKSRYLSTYSDRLESDMDTVVNSFDFE